MLNKKNINTAHESRLSKYNKSYIYRNLHFAIEFLRTNELLNPQDFCDVRDTPARNQHLNRMLTRGVGGV